MQTKSEEGEYTRAEKRDPRAPALQAEDGVVQRQERGFGAPQTDVDEEQADPGHTQEMCREVGRHAVVEGRGW